MVSHETTENIRSIQVHHLHVSIVSETNAGVPAAHDLYETQSSRFGKQASGSVSLWLPSRRCAQLCVHQVRITRELERMRESHNSMPQLYTYFIQLA